MPIGLSLKETKRAPYVRIVLAGKILVNAGYHPVPPTRLDEAENGN
jgi:hypothetical protein